MENKKQVIFKTIQDQTQFFSKTFLSFLMITLLGGIVANAQITWTGSVNNDWNTAGNWDSGTVPGSSDEVIITNATVNLSGVTTIAKLTTTNANLNIGGSTLNINGAFAVSGGQFSNGKVLINSTSNSQNTTISGVSFYTEVEVTGPTITISNSQFYEIAKFKRTYTSGSSNGNTYHKDVTFIALGGQSFNVSKTAVDTFMGNIIVGGATNTYVIIGSDLFTTTLATGKTITIDGTENAPLLNLKRFNQVGATAQNLTGAARITITDCRWEANTFTINGCHIATSNSEYLGEVSFFNGLYPESNSNGNTYHKNVSFITPSAYYGWKVSNNSADTFLENIIVGGHPNSSINIGGDGFTTNLLNGKTITVNPAYKTLHVLSFKNFHQLGNTPQNIVHSGTLWITDCTWEASTFSASENCINTSGSIYQGEVLFLNGHSPQSNSNGNTYHKNVSFVTPTGYYGWNISRNSPDTFTENVTLGGNPNSQILIGGDSFTTYLPNTKTVSVDVSHRTLSFLQMKNFHQQSNTTQTLDITGRIELQNTQWEGNFTAIGSLINNTSSTYSENASFTAGHLPHSYFNDNTFQKNVSFNNVGHYNWYSGNSTPNTYNGDVTVRAIANGFVYMAQGTGTHRFSHDLILEGHRIVFGVNGGETLLEGNNTQTIKPVTGKTGTADFHHLEINKVSNHVDLLTNITIVGQMKFTKGLMKAAPKSDGLLIFNDNATYTGASTNSYVSGWVEKQGNADFVFPIGDDTKYRPLSMASLSASAPVTAYFVNAPEPSGVTAPKCTEISSCEHWVVNSDNTAVTFTLGVEIDNSCLSDATTLFWFDKTQWNALNASKSGNMLIATQTATTVPNNVTSGDHYVTVGKKLSLPGGNVMAGPSSVCQNTTQVYSVPFTTDAIYSWKLPIGWTIATTDPSLNQVTVTIASNAAVGTQTITVIPTLKSDCDLCKLDPITLDVTVNAQPNVGGVVGLTTAKVGYTNITYSVTNTTGVDSFVWTLPTGIAENGSGATGTVTTTVPYINVDFVAGFAGGNINVYGTSAICGNGPTVSMFVSLCTTCRSTNTILADDLKNNHLTVFPNPIMGSEKIKIQIEGQTKISVVNVIIIDEKGAKVKSFTQELQNGVVEIPGQFLAPGKYVLRIQVGSETVGKKILKY